MKLSDIQSRLSGSEIAPGSSEEHRLLNEARALRERETDEFAAVHINTLSAVAAENHVVYPDAAHHAAQVAMEHVTGEHKIVPAPHETPEQ